MRGDCDPSPDDRASLLGCLQCKGKAAMGSVRDVPRFEWSRLQSSGTARDFSRMVSPLKLHFTVRIFDTHMQQTLAVFLV
jgi:hypothetical protein